MLMSIISTILIGFFVGLVARFISPGKDKMGLLATTLVGIIGSLIGRFAGVALGIYKAQEPAGLIASVAGAVVVVALVGLVKPKTMTPTH